MMATIIICEVKVWCRPKERGVDWELWLFILKKLFEFSDKVCLQFYRQTTQQTMSHRPVQLNFKVVRLLLLIRLHFVLQLFQLLFYHAWYFVILALFCN